MYDFTVSICLMQVSFRNLPKHGVQSLYIQEQLKRSMAYAYVQDKNGQKGAPCI